MRQVRALAVSLKASTSPRVIGPPRSETRAGMPGVGSCEPAVPARPTQGRTRMSARLRPHAVPATLLSLAVALALAVAGVLTLSGAKAASPQPKCGDTITADTTLHHDLVNCP